MKITNLLKLMLTGILMLQLSLIASASSLPKEININQATKSLIAPKASHYQWYLDGKLLVAENTQQLHINKAGIYAVALTSKTGVTTFKKVDVAINAAGVIYKIYLIGDSTVSTYTAGYYPRRGWGQELPFFFDSSVQIIDDAAAGTSSKSFYNFQWAPIRNVLKPGDYVFIQFGINDGAKDTARHTVDTGSFKTYLTKFVNETKAKGAHPVIVATLVRNSWTSTGTVYPAYHGYPVAARELAAAIHVPLIDLDKKSTALLESVGQTYSTNFFYNNYVAGDWPNYPNGNKDDVHLQEMGAIAMASLVAQGISELSGDANVSKLIPFLQHDHRITVTNNPANGGLTTITNLYPPGATITLKTIPNSGFALTKWARADGTTASTSHHFSFTMGNVSESFTADFKSGAAVALSAYNAADSVNVLKTIALGNNSDSALGAVSGCYPNPFVNNFTIKTSGAFSYTIRNLDGQIEEKGTATDYITVGNNLKLPGLYIVSITKSNSSIPQNFKVLKQLQ